MEISPQRVRTVEFETVKRGGLDPDAVRAFLDEVATELERAQNQATAMEARARAAVARLQELSEAAPAAQTVPTSEPSGTTADDADEVVDEAPAKKSDVSASVDEAETISRTLLLAQRTADTTVAEAEAEASRIAQEAKDEASKTLDSTREMSARLLDEARDEARRVGESERVAMVAEVDSLKARREFLESDVDHLAQHLADERSRLREAATALLDLTERVPGGLGEVRKPLMSASNDDSLDTASTATSTATSSASGVADDLDDDTATGVVMDDDGAAGAAGSGSGAPEATADDDSGSLWSVADIADDEADSGR